MSELDPMEKFFRENVENHNYPFDEKDWLALEAKLDREMPVKGGNFWGQALAVLFLVTIPWWPWSIDSNKHYSGAEVEQTVPGIETPVSTDASSTIATESSNPPPEVAADSAVETSTDLSSLTKSVSTSTTSATANISEANANNQHPIRESHANSTLTAKPSAVITSEPDHSTSENTDGSKLSTERIRENPLQLSYKWLDHSVAEEDMGFIPTYPYADSTSAQEGVASSISEEHIEKPTDDFQRWRPFVLYGVEYGGTQMDREPKFGYRAGLGVRYFPIKQLSVSVGANYGYIGYSSYGEEYDIDYTFPDGTSINWTDGTCLMYEIPIEARWHPTTWLNVGAGITSYFIETQYYDVYLDTYYGQHVYNAKLEDNETEWFGHLKLSAGFDIPLGRDYVEIEPFYQVPLKGIGFGNTWWKSAGVTVRYLF